MSSAFDNIAPWKNITTETIDGQLMAKIPAFYVKYSTDSSSRPQWQVSATAQDGYELHPAFKRGSTNMSCFYWGVYPSNNGTTAEAPTSQSTWKTNMSLNTSKTACEARNTSSTTAAKRGWHLTNIYEWMAVALLMTIEMGGPDMQALIGTGYGSGYGDGKAMDSDANWRVLKCLYGQNWQWVDGLQANNRVIKVFNPSSTSGHVFNYTTTTASVPANCWWEGFAIDTSTTNQYTKYLFLPSASAASETASATGDYMWSSTSNDRVCRMGGHSSAGSRCGMFCFDLYYDASGSGDHLGFRLAKYGDGIA